jgi:parvulin-like peptidyl-prolyl isomerase
VTVVGSLVGIAVYREKVAPFQTTILVVNNKSITMRYFLKRALMSGEEPRSLLQTLSFEEIIKQTAVRPPFSITVSDDDIDRFIREKARGVSEVIEEREVQEWVRQQVNQSRLSESEFRDLIRTNLLKLRLTQYLAERVPSVAEQVHLYMILQGSLEGAREAKGRLEQGADFRKVSRESNEDERLRDSGGEFGWCPRNALPTPVARAAFDELEMGEVSDPIGLGDGVFGVIMIDDKVAARRVDDWALEVAKSNILEDWLAEELKSHKVEFRGFKNGFDSVTEAWVQWQLDRMSSGRE